ncbi:MAG: hypothetical protein O7F14_09605 [Alphaproteobacteria bacterium]|jgi:hypothetical protein|nr:hypothetical protein [Alphaproteobacteria bacterium]
MSIDLILPISMVMGLLVFGLAGKWYVVPALTGRDLKTVFPPFLLLHATRYVGLAFLIHGVTSEPLDPRFAHPAAYGDLLAAVLALVALAAVRLDWPFSIPLVWIFNIVGTLDLLYAVFQGMRFVPVDHFGAVFFIPAVIVPVLLVTHAIVFWLLLKR